MNFYQTTRTIHFYTAAVTGSFLLLFFITGFFLVRYSWFDHEEKEGEIQELLLSIPSYANEQELAYWLKEELEITGKLDWIDKKKDGKMTIEFQNPREAHIIQLEADRRTVTYERRSHSIYDTLSVLHRTHKYGKEIWYNIYLVLMDVASLSLLVFAITGIYLWLKVIKQKWLGWVMLLAGFGYTLWVVITYLGFVP